MSKPFNTGKLQGKHTPRKDSLHGSLRSFPKESFTLGDQMSFGAGEGQRPGKPTFVSKVKTPKA
jgi:hypothetical protein